MKNFILVVLLALSHVFDVRAEAQETREAPAAAAASGPNSGDPALNPANDCTPEELAAIAANEQKSCNKGARPGNEHTTVTATVLAPPAASIDGPARPGTMHPPAPNTIGQ